MADENTTEDTQEVTEVQDQAQPETQSNDELPDWAREQISKANAEAAKYRTRAKENEAKAKQFEDFEEANKTEQQKLQERAAALESQLAEVTAAKLRSDITVKYGLTNDDAILLGTGDEETLTARAEHIATLRKAAADAAISKPPSNTPQATLKGGNGVVDEPEDDSYPSHWL